MGEETAVQPWIWYVLGPMASKGTDVVIQRQTWGSREKSQPAMSQFGGIYRHWLYSWQWRRKEESLGTSLVVQWLGLWAFTAEGTGSIPGRGTKIPQAAMHSQKKKEKRQEGIGQTPWEAPIFKRYVKEEACWGAWDRIVREARRKPGWSVPTCRDN